MSPPRVGRAGCSPIPASWPSHSMSRIRTVAPPFGTRPNAFSIRTSDRSTAHSQHPACPELRPCSARHASGMSRAEPEARILVIDDEPMIVELLAVSLRFQGFEVVTAISGTDGLDKARRFRPDALIVDVMMPGMDGFGLLRRLRADGIDAPVLFLSARDEVDDKLTGLTLGADDYVTKPFSLEEVIARLRAILRRSGRDAVADLSSRIAVGDIELDEDSHEVWKAGVPVALSPTEFTLL